MPEDAAQKTCHCIRNFSNHKHPLICMSRNLVKGPLRVVDLQGSVAAMQREVPYARWQSTRARTS
jgi:hypothetical protein